MFWSLVIACCIAAVALAGWITCELDLHQTELLLGEAESDRDIAVAWAETQVVENAVVHPTLHLVNGDGGDEKLLRRVLAYLPDNSTIECDVRRRLEGSHT